jgi:hypothetical protein
MTLNKRSCPCNLGSRTGDPPAPGLKLLDEELFSNLMDVLPISSHLRRPGKGSGPGLLSQVL